MSTTVGTQVGRFVWHEHGSSDRKAAKSFYTKLLGWSIDVWKPGEMDYPMISANGQTHGGFNSIDPAQGIPSHWLGHVLVESVDETVARAERLGGRVLMGPIDMPEVGRFAIIADPQGAVLSAYQPAGEGPAGAGVFVWDELLTTDVEGAKRFYGEVFGWTAADMDMGEAGTYTMFKRAGDIDAAGLMRKPDEQPGPPAWLTYLGTDDVDATVAKAGELGGTTLMPGMDIPNVGRFAVLADPTGAVFALFRPAAS